MIDHHWARLAALMLVGMTCLYASGCAQKESASMEPSPHLVSTPSPTVPLPSPTPTPTSEPPPEPTPTEMIERITLSVVYDNNEYDPQLQTAWGFACLVEMDEKTILFDTGGDGSILLSNMATLGINPAAIDIVILSHIHGDHTEGLASLLAAGISPAVYIPRSFPPGFKAQVEAKTTLHEVSRPETIMEGVYTTGEMGSGVIEQALVLKTAKGLVVITGCAHPGIARMVEQAKEMGNDEIYLVLGGFHLGSKSEDEIENIIGEFQKLGVQKVAPCHCTGDLATSLFHRAFGEDFIPNGVGKIIEIGDD